MVDSSISIDTLIAIIAKRHKIIINEKDPILAVATINEYVLNAYLEKSNEALAEAVNNIEKVHFNVLKQSTDNANKILNSSVKKSKNLFNEETAVFIESVENKIKTETELAIKPFAKQLFISNCLLLGSSLIILASVIAFSLF